MPQVFSNRTIDDEFGDSVTGVLPSYSPFWKQGASCGGNCSLHPDPALAFNHTWHDSSQFPASQAESVSLDFVGTAVWVFCIVPPLLPNNITRYNLSFNLDSGAHLGRFVYSPTGGEFLYNVPVVSLPSLPNASHSLLISTDDSISGSVFLFDYAVYTSVEGKDDGRPRISPGAVAGCVLGAVFFIFLVLALLYWRRRRNRKRQLDMVLDPFKDTYDSVSGSNLPMPGDNAPLDAPSALVRQLQQALDTVANMRQTNTNLNDESTQGPGSAIITTGSDSPPPVYQPRVAPIPPRLALKVANHDGQH
ncbi:hypothetical protein DFH06DRAFT_1027286 [Mycena polygramma]|nr:hypothetical protein DFH06DRAFT_1027286 [Mycena polygramma]